mmetsp:Transcript_58/g.125  ORF Transcript_58/g.125 Transcript_58/m.125 type:complete len:462 (+) Transcript_58:69-1454(+)
MLINPFIAAAATVAARAVGTILPGDWTARRSNHYRPESSSREAFPTNQYFMDMEDNMHAQASDFEDFMAKAAASTATASPPIDAEIISKEPEITTTNTEEKTKKQQGSRVLPPPLPNTNDPWILLGIDRRASFDEIRKVYKKLVKIYHPDVAVGPDASAEDRKASNWNFARINAAFDILKRKEEEEVLEYSVYIDGQRVTRSVVVSEDTRRRDPTYVNYDRILEMAEYRKRHPKQRMWYENDRDYQAHNGYGDGYEVSKHSRGKWWAYRNTFDHFHDFDHTEMRDGFGPIQSDQQRWGEGSHFAEEEAGYYRRPNHGHFEVDHGRDHWWDEGSAFDYESPHVDREHQPRHNDMFDSEIKQGYPYKDRYWNDDPSFFEESRGNYDDDGFDYGSQRNSRDYDHTEMKQGYPYKDSFWSEGHSFDQARGVDHNNDDVDYDPQEYFPLKEKWWKGDDPTIGDYTP